MRWWASCRVRENRLFIYPFEYFNNSNFIFTIVDPINKQWYSLYIQGLLPLYLHYSGIGDIYKGNRQDLQFWSQAVFEKRKPMKHYLSQ